MVIVWPATETELMPAPAIVIAPFKLLTEVTELPLVRQVGQVRSPDVALRTNGLEAETATVPDAFGIVRTLVLLVPILERSNWAFLVVSVESWKKVVLLSKVLLVKVWV